MSTFKNHFNQFIIKNNLLQTILVALVSSLYVYSKVVGFIKAYPNQAQRVMVAKGFTHSAGINFLVGPAKDITTNSGYMSWSSLIFVLLIASIWIVLLTNRIYRGNEESGRFDLILGSKGTLLSLSNNLYRSVMSICLIECVIFSSFIILICNMSQVNIPINDGLMFGLAVFLALLMFSSLALLSSQLFNSARKANIFCYLLIMLFILIKAAGDMTSYKWLVNISPLGWFEKLDPIVSKNFVYFLPMIIFSALMLILSLLILRSREPQSSFFKYEMKVKSNINSVASINRIILKFNKNMVLYWILVVALLSFFYGLFTKTIVDTLLSSDKYTKILSKLSQGHGNNIATVYISAIFLICMIILSSMAVYLIGLSRKEELNGRISNILVNPISARYYYLRKIIFYIISLYFAAVIFSLMFYFGAISGGYNNVSLFTLVKSSLNIGTGSIAILAIASIIYSLLPKISQQINYLILWYCILITMLASDTKIPSFFQKINIFYHIKLSPAVNANWKLNIYLILGSLILLFISSTLFTKRDILS